MIVKFQVHSKGVHFRSKEMSFSKSFVPVGIKERLLVEPVETKAKR